jgi:hypothetical protein
MKVELYKFYSYKEVKPFWEKLNRSYKSNELTVDWTAHKIIWDNFYARRNSRLMIVVGMSRGKCIGIFPFISEGLLDPPIWSISEDFIIGQEYFCHPSKIHLFRNLLPEHMNDDMSCFYTPSHSEFFCHTPGGVVDLKDSQQEYFRSLSKKYRHSLNWVLNQNVDIEVRVDHRLHPEEIQGILSSQLDYWLKKNGDKFEGDKFYSRDKINTDLKLMQLAQEMGKLVALYFYLDGELVAANFSVTRENDRIDDYLCLRNCQEEFAHRSLGFLAILKNMEYCRTLGIRYYDLSSCMADYKKKFINTNFFYYYLPSPARANTQNVSRTSWIGNFNPDQTGLRIQVQEA